MMKILFADNCAQENYLADFSINPPQGEMKLG